MCVCGKMGGIRRARNRPQMETKAGGKHVCCSSYVVDNRSRLPGACEPRTASKSAFNGSLVRPRVYVTNLQICPIHVRTQQRTHILGQLLQHVSCLSSFVSLCDKSVCSRRLIRGRAASMAYA